MSYIDANLNPGETVIYQTRLHWIVMLRHIVFGCVLAALGAFLLYVSFNQPGLEPVTTHLLMIAGLVSLVGFVVTILVGAAQRNATEMGVTNRRVIVKVGLMGRRTIEMLLNKIESIEVKETGLGRMLGYGTVVIIGTGGTLEPFDRVAHPLQFRSVVQHQIENLG